MSFPDLANELQDLIITNLHPTAVIALSKTNHYYHSTVSLNRLAFDTVYEFLDNLERRPDNLTRWFPERLACYKCLCMKPSRCFLHTKMGESCSDISHPRRQHRQCMECDRQDGTVAPGGVYFCSSEPWLLCRECFKSSKNFCRGCRSCFYCLKEKGRELCRCGWCDTCVDLTLVEWKATEEIRSRNDGKGGYANGFDAHSFDTKEACSHHPPLYSKVLEVILDAIDAEVREKYLYSSRDELKKSDPSLGEDVGNDKEAQRVSIELEEPQASGKENEEIGEMLEDGSKVRYEEGSPGQEQVHSSHASTIREAS